MSFAFQRRRGTTAQHASFTGLLGEVTVDTDKKVTVVHDGSTAGGFPMLNASGTATLTNKTIAATSNTITGVINNTLTSATGDLIYASSANTPARLAIGSSSQVLTVSGGVPTWATPSGGGGTTLITDVQLSGSSGYSFSSIPSTYKNLVLTWSGLTISALSTNFGLRFNNNSSAVYENYYQYQEAPVSAPTAGTSLGNEVDGACFGNQTTSGNAYQLAKGIITIYDYASTTRHKFYQIQHCYYSNNNSRTNFTSAIGTFASLSAISSLDMIRYTGTSTISNVSNTSMRLYGVS